MFSTVFLAAAVWLGVALVVGVIVGRILRRRTALQRAGQRPQYRNSA